MSYLENEIKRINEKNKEIKKEMEACYKQLIKKMSQNDLNWFNYILEKNN